MAKTPYSASGTDNIRGHQSIKTSPAKDQPSAAGKPTAGTRNFRADLSIKTGPAKSPGKGSDEKPNIFHFSDRKV